MHCNPFNQSGQCACGTVLINAVVGCTIPTSLTCAMTERKRKRKWYEYDLTRPFVIYGAFYIISFSSPHTAPEPARL